MQEIGSLPPVVERPELPDEELGTILGLISRGVAAIAESSFMSSSEVDMPPLSRVRELADEARQIEVGWNSLALKGNDTLRDWYRVQRRSYRELAVQLDLVASADTAKSRTSWLGLRADAAEADRVLIGTPSRDNTQTTYTNPDGGIVVP